MHAKHDVGMDDIVGVHLVALQVALAGQVLNNAYADLGQIGRRQYTLVVGRRDGECANGSDLGVQGRNRGAAFDGKTEDEHEQGAQN